jgi:hypothetical protein
MISQDPNARPPSIADIKALIQRYEAEAVSLQRLSKIRDTVIPVSEIDEPLAHEAPRVVGADWNNGRLTLKLDRPVNRDWVEALHNIGNFTSVMGIPPSAFSFQGDEATVGTRSSDAQRVIDFFKEWLPTATQNLKRIYEERVRREEVQRIETLRAEQRPKPFVTRPRRASVRLREGWSSERRRMPYSFRLPFLLLPTISKCSSRIWTARSAGRRKRER